MTYKHFENLWEEAEFLAKRVDKSDSETTINSITSLLEELKQLPNEATRMRKFGEVLFKLAKLSGEYNINVYTALQLNIKYFQISNMESEE